MKMILMSVVAMSLTACQVPPKFVSQAFDAQDPCQRVGKSQDWTRPDFCKGAGTTVNIQQGISRNQYIITTR